MNTITTDRSEPPKAGTMSIALVDDHRLFLMGFSLLLERIEHDCSVEPFDTPVDLLKALDNGSRFDLVICDLMMNSMNGLAFIAALRGRHDVPVLMISGINTSPPLAEMRQLNAQGFVHKSSDDAELVEAIETVLQGGTYFPHYAPDGDGGADGNFGDVADIYEDGSEVPVLTTRQIEILTLISNGATNKEIARTLSISENTVKTHIKQIFELLKVNKRTASVRAAQALGIL
ncbi:response regulator transcription factor [Pontixanthobacter sp. CEM42]|uniref:response regulator transcription factor n=1 Tax=Pontixanthobacter sp. CEM42 TaxID=2792077 RepID=UPI001ADEEED9|nr:response regulator transcription factor [Pontixanthobacter sp. CEM42]